MHTRVISMEIAGV